jgi:putative polyhydroxyalkanoate system protein
VEANWNKNVLDFSRPGVDGHIEVSAEEVTVTARLSFLLLPIKGAIEQEISKYLEQEFG